MNNTIRHLRGRLSKLPIWDLDRLDPDHRQKVESMLGKPHLHPDDRADLNIALGSVTTAIDDRVRLLTVMRKSEGNRADP